MSDADRKPTEAEEILSETQKLKEEAAESQKSETTQTAEPQPSEATPSSEEPSSQRQSNIVFVGIKPLLTYVTATLTQLATQPTVTIKARGKRITQAVDVSQMIVKRMNTVGYMVNKVSISSDSLTSQDGKQRNVSSIEIDLTKK